MHPTVATEAELLALAGSLPFARNLTTSRAGCDLPDAGKMEDLLTIARTRCQATRESSKARKQAERFDTAAWWEYGQVLDRIRTGCTHKGEWGEALKAIGETKKGASRITIEPRKRSRFSRSFRPRRMLPRSACVRR